MTIATHQQHMNKTTDGGGADHAEQPQDEQDDRDCFKHGTALYASSERNAVRMCTQAGLS